MRSKLSNLLCPPCPFCVLPGRPEQEIAGGGRGGKTRKGKNTREKEKGGEESGGKK